MHQIEHMGFGQVIWMDVPHGDIPAYVGQVMVTTKETNFCFGAPARISDVGETGEPDGRLD